MKYQTAFAIAIKLVSKTSFLIILILTITLVFILVASHIESYSKG